MNTKLLYLSVAALILTFASCNKKDEQAAGSTPFSVRMTDAPANYDAVYVNVKAIEIKKDGGDILMDVAKRFDLLKLSNGADTLLASAKIPSGKISQIRLILSDDSNEVVIGGVSYPLSTPSAQQSGLKLNLHATLVPDIDYSILLDFDASCSIVESGNGKYSLKPVIRVIEETTTGSIKGAVLPTTVHPSVQAISGVDTFGTTTDETGKFLLRGLPEGSYSLLIKADTYQDATVSNLSVNIGEVTDAGIIQLVK